jgi:hypothetical protein
MDMQLFGYKCLTRIRKPNSYQIRDGERDYNPSFFHTATTISSDGTVGRRFDIGRFYLHVAKYDS